MGYPKKYEAHTRFPFCCFAIDVKSLAYVLSSIGIAFCVYTAIAALKLGYPTIFSLSCLYLLSFAAIILGELNNKPSYLMLFLILNGTAIVFQVFMALSISIVASIGPEYFLNHNDEFYSHAIEEIERDAFAHTSTANNATLTLDLTSAKTKHELLFILQILIVLTLVIMVLVNLLMQSIIFHAYRSMQLRKKLEYRPYSGDAPITHQLGNGGGGHNSYISTIKRPVFAG